MPQMSGFEIEMNDEEVKTLYYAVCEAIKVWPGSPARPAEEQERLHFIKQQLFRMVLQISLES